MQYIVDNILNGLDAAKNDVIQFLIGYGFLLDATTGSMEEAWNKELYLRIKDSFFYFEDPVRFYFIINFPLLILPNHRHNPTIGTRSF